METGFYVALLIFISTLAFIFLERIHRTIIAIAGAGLMISAGIFLGFYREKEAAASIDFSTLGLLFGMMVLVALLRPTGFFEYLAIQAGRISKGNPVRLLIMLGVVTTVLSMFLDNVTTVILIAPVTILICEVLGLNPAPFLISEAILSNTGGIGTLVGDPPNVLIGSAVPFTFGDFITHTLPVVVVVWAAVLALLLWMFRKELVGTPKMVERVNQLDPSRALDDVATARKVLIVLGVAVFFFFIHHRFHVSPAFVAMAAAAIALIWVNPKDLTDVFERVEWTALVFFAALFVMVGGLESAGVLTWLAERILSIGANIEPVWFGVLLIWAVALLSAVIDNIPVTIALIPVIAQLGTSGMNAEPLWWALAFGAGFGGNGTIIGSTANIIVVSLSEKTKTPITAKSWSRVGIPAMLLACSITSVLYVIFYPWFGG